jgi:signal peptidase I
MRSHVRRWTSWAGIALVAAVISGVASSTAYRVHGRSMEPTLLDGDLVWLSACTTARYCSTRVGDLVVFRPSKDSRDERIIKRVAAGPGDVVEMVNTRLLVNRRPILEGRADVGARPPEWVASRMVATFTSRPFDSGNWGPIVLGPEELFVLGDNPPASRDSRVLGAIPLSRVIARSGHCIRASRSPVPGFRMFKRCHAS